MEKEESLLNKKNLKKNKFKNNIKNKTINQSSQDMKMTINKIPSIINNYDIKVNITKKKSNKISINNMNINSIYSKSNTLDNTKDLDLKKNNIFKSIKLNKYLNKNEKLLTSEYKREKQNSNLNELSIKNNKNINYEKIISKLKNEFQIIENSYNIEYLNKTEYLQKDNNFNSNEFLKKLNIKLLNSKDKLIIKGL